MAVKMKLSPAQAELMKVVGDPSRKPTASDFRTGKALTKKGLLNFYPVLGWVLTAAGWQWLKENGLMGGENNGH